MNDTSQTEERHWFVLNFIRKPGNQTPQKFIDNFNREGERLELFAPVIRPAQVVDGKVVYREQLLTYFYVFVRGTLEDVKSLCSSPENGLSLMLDRGSEHRYGMVSDSVMESFRIIARLYTNTVPFFNIEDIHLHEGDIVQVVDGPYAGLTGTYMPRSRSNKGNLVIAATAALGAIVWDVEARYVRILQFAHDTRRQYDILDAFIPRLYPILRKYHSGEALSESEKSQLSHFNLRMGIVVPDNPKLEAKLLAVLQAVQTILGDQSSLDSTAQRLARRRQSVTNAWTIAFMSLLECVVNNDFGLLETIADTIYAEKLSDRITASQSQLLNEINYYLGKDYQ